MGPWRPPAPQPRRGREERTGFYSLRRKETSLGEGMRSVWGASGKLRMTVCNFGQRLGWRKAGDRGEESKSSHDQSVLSTLMTAGRLLSLPTASHFHITAVNRRRDACQKRGTWRHMGAKCHWGPHTCVLAPTREKYTQEHTHKAIDHRGIHICMQTHTHVQVYRWQMYTNTPTQIHAHVNTPTEATGTQFSGEGEARFQCAVESCHLPCWWFSAARQSNPVWSQSLPLQCVHVKHAKSTLHWSASPRLPIPSPFQVNYCDWRTAPN